MFKLISKLGMGDPCATNVQIMQNQSQWPINVKITSGKNIWTETIPVGETKRINATRDEIGEVTAHVTLTYSNARVLEYTFRITPKYCEDNIIIRDDHVEYNSEKRGTINKENELKYLAQQQAIKDAEEKAQKEKDKLIYERKEAEKQQQKAIKDTEERARLQQQQAIKDAEEKARIQQQKAIKDAEEKAQKEKDKLIYERKEAQRQQQERDKKINELKTAAIKERERADKEIKELERLSVAQQDSIASLVEQQICYEAEEEARKQFEEEMRLKYSEFQEKLKKEKGSTSATKFDYKQDVGLENLTVESLRNICLRKNISTNGLTTKQDFVNKINQYLKSPSIDA